MYHWPVCRERKNERTNEQISLESPLTLTRCKSSLLHFIPSLRILVFIVTENPLMKNLTLAYIVRKKNERIIEQISWASPLSLTQYKSSSLHCIPSLRFLAFIIPVKSLTRNLPLASEERGKMKEQISLESPLSLTQYKSSLLHIIPSLRILAFLFPENSLMKNLTLACMERKKNERTNEQWSRESLLSLTLYKSSILTKNLTLAYMERRKNERTNEQRSWESP